MHHISGNSKISINIKANYSLKVLPEKNRQINEDNFDKRKMFWGAFHASRIEKEINSKPCCFESERELVFETGATFLVFQWLCRQKRESNHTF